MRDGHSSTHGASTGSARTIPSSSANIWTGDARSARMKHARLADMTGGWFVGDFQPTCLQTTACEVACKHYEAGAAEPRHVHRVATELTLIASGRVVMNGTTFESRRHRHSGSRRRGRFPDARADDNRRREDAERRAATSIRPDGDEGVRREPHLGDPVRSRRRAD